MIKQINWHLSDTVFRLTNMIPSQLTLKWEYCVQQGTTLEKFMHLKIFIELHMKNHTLQQEHKDE